MALPTNVISGKTYTKIVVPDGGDGYLISPFDLNGNVVPEMTIEVDASLGSCSLYLPEIASFNNVWNTKILVIAILPDVIPLGAGITVYPSDPLTNLISGNPELPLLSNGNIVQFTIASDTNWFALQSPFSRIRPIE
jgi:hypothetical protein